MHSHWLPCTGPPILGRRPHWSLSSPGWVRSLPFCTLPSRRGEVARGGVAKCGATGEEPGAALQPQTWGPSQEGAGVGGQGGQSFQEGCWGGFLQHPLFSPQILQLCVLSRVSGQRDPGFLQDENIRRISHDCNDLQGLWGKWEGLCTPDRGLWALPAGRRMSGTPEASGRNQVRKGG